MLPLDDAPTPSMVNNQHDIMSYRKWRLISIATYVLLFIIGCIVIPRAFHSNGGDVVCTKNGQPIVDVFPGPAWRTSQTISSRLLLSDSRMRVESHDVRGEDNRIYHDWIWMDVVDQINVLPYILPPESEIPYGQNRYSSGRFRVFKQKKYGLINESLAVCGGQIEMSRNETPLSAAARELDEEMSLKIDDTSRDSKWIDLGTYRVNVNRGHGTVSCFLLFGAVSTKSASSNANEEFHVDELERQDVVELSIDEIEEAMRSHRFAEIKWQATVALALDEVKRRIAEEDHFMKGLVWENVVVEVDDSLNSRASPPSNSRLDIRDRSKTRRPRNGDTDTRG